MTAPVQGKDCPAYALVGRESELNQIEACLRAGRNVLLEGTVGVGKTHLALAVAGRLGLPVFRVDGDARYSEQKLTGWFDPPAVLQRGYTAETFFPGPLTDAMRAGGLLLINELNRLPEGVQNVLLPAIDEGLIQVPRLGEIRSVPGFRVVATQNPHDFVATSHLSEAILDRFELVRLDYQSAHDETRIVLLHLPENAVSAQLAREAVRVTRATRNDARIRRGASVRAAMAMAQVAVVFMEQGRPLAEALREAAQLVLPTRIELERDFADIEKSAEQSMAQLLHDLLAAPDFAPVPPAEKKTLTPV